MARGFAALSVIKYIQIMVIVQFHKFSVLAAYYASHSAQ